MPIQSSDRMRSLKEKKLLQQQTEKPRQAEKPAAKDIDFEKKLEESLKDLLRLLLGSE